MIYFEITTNIHLVFKDDLEGILIKSIGFVVALYVPWIPLL